MENARVRVRQACDRCRCKKVKCNGAYACDRCVAENTICSYMSDRRQQGSTSMATVLAAQNEQLGRAIQNLYAYVQSGNSLPVLSIGDDGKPLVHDIVVFANTLPDQARYLEGKSPQETLQSSNSLDEVSAWAQTEPWLGPSPMASIPEMMNSTLQSQAQYEEENQADVEDIWSMVDVNASEAATLYAFLQSLRASS